MTFNYLGVCVALLCSFAVISMAQIVQPSNRSADLTPIATSARFLLNGTEFPNLPAIRLAPLLQYAELTKPDFLSVAIGGRLVNVGASNQDSVENNQFVYISCDPQAYNGYLSASDVFNSVLWGPNTQIIILYSEYSDHCNVSLATSAPVIGGILTTVDPMTATALANLNLNANSKGNAELLPDLNSYTNVSGSGGWANGSGVLGPSPTTAVAMIILYSITGVITALFILIIVTGAIRAHRHPERYGPRNVAGRTRQSRAKGIARAMLETLPIVKFGDQTESPVKAPAGGPDIEMNAASAETRKEEDDAAAIDRSTTTTDGETEPKEGALESAAVTVEPQIHKGDGTQDDGTLICSICTEDFTKGEEVRVLPCNHKFHPDCVDPWLLNVSGTCPLCRIDLQGKATEQKAEYNDGTSRQDLEGSNDSDVPGEERAILPPPLAEHGRWDTVTSLSRAASGTREERIAALRRLRQERTAGVRSSTEAERRGLSSRLRDRFRIRTMRNDQDRRPTLENVDEINGVVETEILGPRGNSVR